MAVTSPQQGCFCLSAFPFSHFLVWESLIHTPVESTSIICMYLGHRHTLLDVMVEIATRSVHTRIQVCFIHGQFVINKRADITV
jgi:hypothetical protein